MAKVKISLAYHNLPAPMVVPFIGTIIAGMKGNADLPNPPVPLEPAVPVDPDAPVDLTTRKTQLEAAIEAAAVGGSADTAAKNDALEFALDGLDQEAFYVQSVYRYNTTGVLATGFMPASTNRAQVVLDTPGITGIDTDVSAQLTLHVTPIDNAYGYELQTRIGTADWKTVLYSSQARSIVLAGQTSGTAVNVRVRALGGLTGYSAWSLDVTRYVS
jgi:hypothetical protein